MNLFPAIVQAVPGDNFTVYAYCNDGAIRLIDVKPLIEKGGVFKPLENIDFFQTRLTIINDTVAWDISGDWDAEKCVDLDPCWIFEDAPIVDDPLVNENISA